LHGIKGNIDRVRSHSTTSLGNGINDFEGEAMPVAKFQKGPKLFSLARKKALRLGVPQEKGVKLAELIERIQQKEGNTPCFGKKNACSEITCCWQASCKAEIIIS